MSDLSKYGDPVQRHERCMRKITPSGRRYLRCSEFNPETATTMAGHDVTGGFTPCRLEQRRFYVPFG